MKKMHRLALTIPTLAAALLLTACMQTGTGASTTNQGSAADPVQAKLIWFNTGVGAVKCLTAEYHGYRGGNYPTHDCNWSTLKTDAVAGAETLPGVYLNSEYGRTYCVRDRLTNDSYGNTPYYTYSCDWARATTVSN